MVLVLAGMILPLVGLASSKPPKAEKIPHEMTQFGDKRVDEYYWVRDVKNPKVKSLLNEENKYYKSYFSANDLKLKSTIVEEIKSRIEEDEITPEIVYGDWAHYSKISKGQNYYVHYRKHLKTNKEEILLDENKRAEKQKFFAVRSSHMSPDLERISWCFDYDGSGKCEVEIQDLKTLDFKKTGITGVHWGSLSWGPDSKSLFYVMPNEAWRAESVWMMDEKLEKKKVLSEPDELYEVGISLSSDDETLFVESQSYETSRNYYWDGDKFEPLIPSRNKIQTSVDHSENGYYVRSNHISKNFGIYHFKRIGTPMDSWTEVVSPSVHAKLMEMIPLKESVVYSLLSNGNREIHVFDLKEKKDKIVNFSEATYGAYFSQEGKPGKIYVQYSSPLAPTKTFGLNTKSLELQLIKAKNAPHLDPSLYTTELRHVNSRDGKSIPIHLVYKKSEKKGPRPTLLYGYGSYGLTVPSRFNETLFSLLDRDFIYVSAHVRGSDAQGEDWYDDGKMMNKKNTFNDFIDVSDYLIREGLTSPRHLAIRGASAGGLLIGAVLNQKPKNFRAAIAEVPFVDILTTMLDPSMPLVTQEYLQWGNPNEEAAYNYIKSYSPYDNIKKQDYPAIYVETGINDQQVSYWEPTKWVQRLRESSKSKYPVIMKCNMGAGHGGSSGRYSKYMETAEKYVFLIKEISK